MYVAAMLVHGLTHILTFNTTDFRRYAEITLVFASGALRARQAEGKIEAPAAREARRKICRRLYCPSGMISF